MKRIVSVSLGSSKRNHAAEIEALGEKIIVERIGTDGDMAKVIELIKELDGKVDAFGMGGIDLYLRAGNRSYILRDARKIARAAVKSPMVDGTGLKNTLERKAVYYMRDVLKMPIKDAKVLMTAGVDRFGMAEAFEESGAKVTYGDLIFALGIPVPIRSIKVLHILAAILLPVLAQFPFSMLYPTGKKQETNTPRFPKFFREADIIAGDFLFIKKYMPEDMSGKVILTNTVTPADIEELKRRGVKTLVTTTPELNGRSFGTNVMEALLVSLSGKKPSEISPQDYIDLLDRMKFVPRVEHLN